LEFFQFFFTPEIVNDIVEQTNLYGMQQSKRNNAWTYITYEEILAFFGIVAAVDTKRIVAESKHGKRLATIVQNVMHLSAKNVLNVFIPRAT